MKDDPKIREALEEIEASLDLLRTRLQDERPRAEILQAAKATYTDACWLLGVVKESK